jgi:hypothetical protein
MPRFATEDGKGTNDPAQAQKDPNGQPVPNATREVWVSDDGAAAGNSFPRRGVIQSVSLIAPSTRKEPRAVWARTELPLPSVRG